MQYEGLSRSNYIRLKHGADQLIRDMFLMTVRTRPDGLSAVIDMDGNETIVTDDDLNPETLELATRLGLDIASLEGTSLSDVIHCLAEPGQIFIWTGAGHEGARYVSGFALSIDTSDGTIVEKIYLSRIAELTAAARPGVEFTEPTY